MVYRNACGNMETKRVSVKKTPKYEKHSSAKPYLRKLSKKLTTQEINNYMAALCC